MKDAIGWIIGIVIIWTVFSWIGGWGKYEGESAEYWFNAYDEENARAENYKTALEEANANIEEANYNIEEANSRISSVKSSNDVEELIDNADYLSEIDIVDLVDEPY